MLKNEELMQLTLMVEDVRMTVEEIATYEDLLKKKNARLVQLTEVDIPLAMQQFGVDEIKLTDGTKLSLKEEVYASIAKAHKEDAFDWLEGNGFGDIVKNQVVATLGRDSTDKAVDAVNALVKMGIDDVRDERSVHASTLKAWAKESLANGVDFPMELFGVHTVQKALVK